MCLGKVYSTSLDDFCLVGELLASFSWLADVSDLLTECFVFAAGFRDLLVGVWQELIENERLVFGDFFISEFGFRLLFFFFLSMRMLY